MCGTKQFVLITFHQGAFFLCVCGFFVCSCPHVPVYFHAERILFGAAGVNAWCKLKRMQTYLEIPIFLDSCKSFEQLESVLGKLPVDYLVVCLLLMW